MAITNTAIGYLALDSNTSGSQNTATGNEALSANTTGIQNTASGSNALFSNTIGSSNAASGFSALYFNTTGAGETAEGAFALYHNTTGANNVAMGVYALLSNTTGNYNTALGTAALEYSTGANNIALGYQAGLNLTTGSNNIDIGNAGVAGDASKIRIGKSASATYISGIYGKTASSLTASAVFVDSSGHLGTVKSSARFKDEIKPMDKASETLLALQPVTFRYKEDLDPDGVLQFGLIAEQVEKVNPALVIRDEDGMVMTVRYEAVNAMLLNEFLKQHSKVEEQETTIAQQRKDFQATTGKLEAAIAQQQNEIKTLTASLKDQALQIRKVSDQLEVSKPAPQMVVNNQ